ncbi:hypothetical protein D9611_002769 [Ephemerocybe angulata]|uniref:Uncharacterized protein n=1 Tax=Ephemerocybe angulata TaxID=980116 RepID=A0A8H5C2G3_9AGAR|nr:hypothetical protein D9611_002769 [Tulosesus angulatus]
MSTPAGNNEHSSRPYFELPFNKGETDKSSFYFHNPLDHSTTLFPPCMPRTVQIIRDVITIADDSPYGAAELQRGDTLRLIAREITITKPWDLKGVNLQIYAETLNILNDVIIYNRGVNGIPGSAGSAGKDGNDPLKTFGVGAMAALSEAELAKLYNSWISGGVGGAGSDGSNGGDVKIDVENIVGRARIDARGGDGGDGGPGGNGYSFGVRSYGPGPFPPFDNPDIVLKSGGSGGKGGKGGRRGLGGEVLVWAHNRGADSEMELNAIDGEPGKGGAGGRPGANETGKRSGFPTLFERWPKEVTNPPGNNGEKGDVGGLGEVYTSGMGTNATIFSLEAIQDYVRSQPFASQWARHRHAVGEFYFRSYVPGSPERGHYAGLAVHEFKAAIRLNPLQTDSRLRLEQIWNDINPLGLPRNLDVIPNFKEYMDRFADLTGVEATISGIASNLLLQVGNLQGFKALFKGEKAHSDIRIDDATADLEISKQTEKDLAKALEEKKAIMDEVVKQIEAQQEEMKKPLTIGSIIGSFADVAVAVSALAAAIPTGGASLVALLPEIISFTKTVYESFTPMVQAMLDENEDATRKVVMDAHDEVRKDSTEIRDAKVTNLPKLIATLRGTKAAENEKLMDLLVKGAEMVYENLLKQQELRRAKMRTKALEEKLVSEKALRGYYESAIARTGLDQAIVREAGLKAIQAALSKIDIILGFAFRAQRSLEIYLLQSHVDHVVYDIGRIHPDLEADYLFFERDHSLAESYTTSFTKMLGPAEMWRTYQEHLDKPIHSYIHRLSFTDPKVLDTFRSTFTLTFDFDVAKAISKDWFSTKFQASAVSFVGATGMGNMVSCKLEHSAVYSERMRNKAIHQSILHPRHEIIQASIFHLNLEVDLQSSPPLDGPNSSPLWGMGVGGLYTITIPKKEFENHHPTFDGLKEIEVWIKYQFMEEGDSE